MTCKDCIHYDVCYAVKAVGENQESDKYCMSFKNKADYAEVKHGEWEAKASTHISKRGRLINYDRYKCSVCGMWNGRHKPNYCPNCGSKMDGRSDT